METILDHKDKNIPIQVISAIDTTGKIKPLIFKYEDPETHEIHKITIESINSSKSIRPVGFNMEQFICTAMINDVKRIFELRYLIDTHKWIFFQMLS